ncbi:MAG: beta-galactosidase trimerization domain-containing protein [Candidatus Firestonebacteria bacterium]
MRTEWYKAARIHLEWLNPKIDLDVPKYVNEMLDSVEKVNANAIAYVIDNGGYILYDGKSAPKDKHIGNYDLIAMIEKEAHKRGLRFIAGFYGVHSKTYLCNEYPHWVQLDKEGKPTGWSNFLILCPNSPFGDYYPERIKEIVSKYKVDGIYVEGIYFGAGFCYCYYCREKFKGKYEREIPTDATDRQLKQFHQETITDFYRKIREVVDEVSPDTIITGATYTLFQELGRSSLRDSNIKTLSKYVDVISMEGQWGYYDNDISLREISLYNLMLKAESKKPILNTQFVSKNVDYDYAQRTPEHTKLAIMENMSQGAIVQVHVQTAFEEDESLMPTLKELFVDIEKLNSYVIDSESLKYAAILNWSSPEDNEDYFSDALKGFYFTLSEYHIPTDIVIPEDIENSCLKNYSVLILPNAKRLSSKVIDCIEEYVKNGGGLVMTYKTGWEDKENRLMKLLGVQNRLGVINNLEKNATVGLRGGPKFLPHTYYKIHSKEKIWEKLNKKLLSFRGGYIQLETEKSVLPMAEILGFDDSRRHRDHCLMGGYPNNEINPMILTQKLGKGKILYITAELDAICHRFGCKDNMEVLVNSVLSVSEKDVSLKTNLSGSVEVVTHIKGKSVAILLLNQTTNQLKPYSVVRYVVPINKIEIGIKIGNKIPKRVKSLKNAKINFKKEKDWLHITLEKLNEYECIMIDL